MFSTHSEPGDLSDKFELESEGLHEKVTDSISGMKVAHYDQRNLRKQREKCFEKKGFMVSGTISSKMRANCPPFCDRLEIYLYHWKGEIVF